MRLWLLLLEIDLGDMGIQMVLFLVLLLNLLVSSKLRQVLLQLVMLSYA